MHDCKIHMPFVQLRRLSLLLLCLFAKTRPEKNLARVAVSSIAERCQRPRTCRNGHGHAGGARLVTVLNRWRSHLHVRKLSHANRKMPYNRRHGAAGGTLGSKRKGARNNDASARILRRMDRPLSRYMHTLASTPRPPPRQPTAQQHNAMGVIMHWRVIARYIVQIEKGT